MLVQSNNEFKRISYYLGLFCFPVSILAFINILYSSYFDYFLHKSLYRNFSLLFGFSLTFIGKNSEKN